MDKEKLINEICEAEYFGGMEEALKVIAPIQAEIDELNNLHKVNVRARVNKEQRIQKLQAEIDELKKVNKFITEGSNRALNIMQAEIDAFVEFIDEAEFTYAVDQEKAWKLIDKHRGSDMKTNMYDDPSILLKEAQAEIERLLADIDTKNGIIQRHQTIEEYHGEVMCRLRNGETDVPLTATEITYMAKHRGK